MVGWAMRGVVQERGLPCQRVVNHAGYLSGGWAFGHPDIMRELLMAEGVPFTSEYTVDLKQCVWDPADELDRLDLPVWFAPSALLAATDEMDDFDLITGINDPGGEI